MANHSRNIVAGAITSQRKNQSHQVAKCFLTGSQAIHKKAIGLMTSRKNRI